MEGIVVFLITWSIFRILLHILNTKIWGIFMPMQRDLAKLSKMNRFILNFVGIVSAGTMSAVLTIGLGLSSVMGNITLCFLLALVDICFSKDIKEEKETCNLT